MLHSKHNYWGHELPFGVT